MLVFFGGLEFNVNLPDQFGIVRKMGFVSFSACL